MHTTAHGRRKANAGRIHEHQSPYILQSLALVIWFSTTREEREEAKESYLENRRIKGIMR
jgi:hypothetical protein